MTWAAACSGEIADPTAPGTNGPQDPSSPASPGGKTPSGTANPGGPSTGSPAGAPGSDAPAPATVRRLTGREITSSIRDIFFPGAPLDLAFLPDKEVHSFENESAGRHVTQRFAEDLQSAAEKAASLAVAKLGQLLPCSAGVAAAAERSCAQDFVRTYGTRVYRRPLTDDDQATLMGVFDQARGRETFPNAIGIAIEAMLQSPHFVFRTELGAAKTSGNVVVSLSPYETATALSYFLWQSTPDAALLDAAASGKLTTRAQIAEQARRLLADPRARDTHRAFLAEWLEIDELEKGLASGHPLFSKEMAAAMVAESHRFADEIGWGAKSTLEALLRSNQTFVNAQTARLYGLTGANAPTGDALMPVTLDKSRRSGFLTQPAFLVAHAPPLGSSPIFLGHFIRTRLFCQTPPEVPAGIPQPSADPNLSTRDRFAMHSQSASCRGCHLLLDPIGFGFERYDSLGVERDVEIAGGKSYPLTGEGALAETDVDGAFRGPVELAERLARSGAVADCFTAQLLRFALGRNTAAPEGRRALDTEALRALAKDPRGDLRRGGIDTLLGAIATTDAFLLRDARNVP